MVLLLDQRHIRKTVELKFFDLLIMGGGTGGSGWGQGFMDRETRDWTHGTFSCGANIANCEDLSFSSRLYML